MTARTLAAAMLVALVGAALAQPKQPEPLPPPKAEKPDIPKLLATRVTVDKFEGKFKDAVAMLSDKYGVPVIIDLRGAAEPLDTGEVPSGDSSVKLPKLVNVRLDTVLQVLARQVHGKALVYPEYVKIVPDLFAAYETGVLTVVRDDPEDVPLIPLSDIFRTKPLIKRALVSASFKNKPLSEVLDEIAESTGATVTLSPLVAANVRQNPITARFANTPVDAAVRTLCEMTECGVIEDANVLLVTTRERAAARAKEDAERQRAKHLSPPAGLSTGGPGGLAVPPDTTAEIAKLKEQNEQLKRQIEELQKQMKKLTEKPAPDVAK